MQAFYSFSWVHCLFYLKFIVRKVNKKGLFDEVKNKNNSYDSNSVSNLGYKKLNTTITDVIKNMLVSLSKTCLFYKKTKFLCKTGYPVKNWNFCLKNCIFWQKLDVLEKLDVSFRNWIILTKKTWFFMSKTWFVRQKLDFFVSTIIQSEWMK